MKPTDAGRKRRRALLCCVLCFALLAAPVSASAVISPQSLTVNGEPVACEAYNIDGCNYFRLRDLAYVLNGTTSQFSVDWDDDADTVSITTGRAYVPLWTELSVGADRSASAVRSAQTILINGSAHDELDVQNIGGSNFFQLRELGQVLGFDVSYIAATNTVAVSSRAVSTGTRLTETSDGGRNYLNRLIFLGDSTTYGIGAYYRAGYTDLCPATQVWTPASGTLTLSNYSFATIVYPQTGEELTITEAVTRSKPEYLVITLGVNGVSFMDEDWFIRDYTALVQNIQTASPDTKIILNSIYPVAVSYQYQSSINNQKINAANGWIEQIAADTGCRFLYSFEAVVGADGYLPESSQNGDGLHLNGGAFCTVMQYIRTHAYF
ncbi:MAG: GDSL-type esterase/lipase family protein [Oscillospiraceae bacterium]|nr:GDSL-type esterase/lipase family protein [Oscillospiraceae bacterium]